MHYAVPLRLRPCNKLGTGFFWEKNGVQYLVTNRHNVTQHTNTWTEPDGSEASLQKDSQKNHIDVLDPTKVRLPSMSPNVDIEDIVIHSFSTDLDMIIDNPRQDVACVPVDSINPEEFGVSIFNSEARVNSGSKVQIQSYHANGIQPQSFEAEVSNCVIGLESNCQCGIVDKRPQAGSSGSPVYTNEGLVGALFLTDDRFGKCWVAYVQADAIVELVETN